MRARVRHGITASLLASIGILFLIGPLTACGGATTETGAATSDAGGDAGQFRDGAPTEDATLSDDAAPGPVALLKLGAQEYVGMLAFDDRYVYAAVFSPNLASVQVCDWTSRWVKIAKDGSSYSELGDAATTCLSGGATAVILNDALYWLGAASASFDASAGGGVSASLMTMPTTGGSATDIHDYAMGLDGIGTDGHDLFAVSRGTDGIEEEFTDGAILRLAADGTPTVLASNQVLAQWVGITSGYITWTTELDCVLGSGNCQTIAFNEMPIGGGTPIEVATIPVNAIAATATRGAIYYYDGVSSVQQLPLDGGEATAFATVPWNLSQNGDFLSTLRVSGNEVIASTSDTDSYLLAAPIPYQAPWLSFSTFDVDEGGVYAQFDGGLMRLAVP